MAKKKQEELSPFRHALRSALWVIAAIIAILIFAYGITVTQINLEEPQDPQRQAVTTRVIRALARPDFFEFDEEIRSMDILIRMPCPAEISGAQTSLGDRVVTLRPNCASTTQDLLTVEGTGFRPRTDGILRWHPAGSVATTRALTTFRTDRDGNFSVEFTMPDIRPTDEPQRIEVEESWNTGIKGPSETLVITIEKIIETIFLALIATTAGTILAVPISFIAARNLMEPVGLPLAAIASALIAVPIGWFIGSGVVGGITILGMDIPGLLDIAALPLFDNAIVSVGTAIVAVVLAWLLIRIGPPILTDEPQPVSRQIISIIRLVFASMLIFLAIALLASQGVVLGSWLEDQLPQISFIGNFIALVSEAVLVLSPAVVGLLLALMATSFGSKYGQEAVLQTSGTLARVITAVTTALGTFVLFSGVGAALNWLYQFDEPQWIIIVAAIAGVIAGIIGAVIEPKRPFRIGFTIYTITRSILNIIRSIEPLIYVIVFAVWVGIGPFAGVLALTIHTIAALGKLFSEQVEDIDDGPVEAVTATGANRLQVINFSVIPQIVPSYIAFTLYRWDINVRFSTVIGFAGGGGIGFVLVQNINLLRYRQAAVMMIAIAVVVMSLDYISSKIRSRII
jgi:phosphonate ABC transporter permease subunit PhnE